MQTSTADIILSNNNTELKLNYLCKTSQVSYSISDLFGNIIKCGDYDCLVDNAVSIVDLSEGSYQLCIIDGDKFCKTRFKKS
jgi:hypothetical protein